MLTYIEIARIHPHPHNPRVDLGDLAELAESIKASGILQNLTVVPVDPELYRRKINSKKAYTGDYTAVIGHRRLAAAQMAGLSELPCSVADMDEKMQVATMLLENMQRSDLTVWEQAQGFQMMLDFGETPVSIGEKTGFSESTVRRRVKLLELDRDKFKESVDRGATLFEYAELDKIKDIELKNAVLDKSGTKNFQWELKNAIDKQKMEEDKAALIEQLRTFASPIEDNDGLYRVKYISITGSPLEIPGDADKVDYYYHVDEWGIVLYKDTPDMEEDDGKAETLRLMEERSSQLKEITSRAYSLRLEFISKNAGLKKHSSAVATFAAQALLPYIGYRRFNKELFADLIGIELAEGKRFTPDDGAEAISDYPERGLFAAAYCSYGDSREMGYYKYYDCKYAKNEELDAIYDFLESIGYEMSDEECVLRNGTHELFALDES